MEDESYICRQAILYFNQNYFDLAIQVCKLLRSIKSVELIEQYIIDNKMDGHIHLSVISELKRNINKINQVDQHADQELQNLKIVLND